MFVVIVTEGKREDIEKQWVRIFEYKTEKDVYIKDNNYDNGKNWRVAEEVKDGDEIDGINY